MRKPKPGMLTDRSKVMLTPDCCLRRWNLRIKPIVFCIWKFKSKDNLTDFSHAQLKLDCVSLNITCLPIQHHSE